MARRRGFGMFGTTGALLTLGLALAAAAPEAWAVGGGGAPTVGPEVGPHGGSRAYEKIASRKYERGRFYVEKARAHEEGLASAPSEQERQVLRERAANEYQRALRYFRSAVSREPDLHAAHSDMGFVLRSLGNYEEALEAYDTALRIQADYAPAIEYRGEAYLELGRLEDAKAAYMQLFGPQRELADLLMSKMEAWVAHRREDPAQLDPAVVEAFGRWVEDRGEIARRTARLGDGAPRGW